MSPSEHRSSIYSSMSHAWLTGIGSILSMGPTSVPPHRYVSFLESRWPTENALLADWLNVASDVERAMAQPEAVYHVEHVNAMIGTSPKAPVPAVELALERRQQKETPG